MEQVFMSIKRTLIAGIAAIMLATVAGTTILSTQNSSAYGKPSYTSGIKHVSLDHPQRFQFWKMSPMYDLKTLKRVGTYRKGQTIEVTRMAYKKGGFFYLNRDSYKKGKFYGVFINSVFRINKAGTKAYMGKRWLKLARNGQVVFNNRLVPVRNAMPLTQHYTLMGGSGCTSKRIWYQGLDPNMVQAVQKAELTLGAPLPINTAYRSYSEQACLWNKLGHNTAKVAPPGRSRHNWGKAIDVDSGFIDRHQSTLWNAGLCRPAAIRYSDPVHLELRGDRC